jgi:hypothetical protein
MAIPLTRQEISSHGNLGTRLKPPVLAQFKAKSEGGCDLLHLGPHKGNTDVYIRPAGGKGLKRTNLPQWFESRKKGKEKLVVSGMSGVPFPTIYVSSLVSEELDTIQGMAFEQLAELGSFVLESNLHVIVKNTGGEDVLIIKRDSRGKLTMAVNDLVDANLLGSEDDSSTVWPTTALSQFKDTADPAKLKYLGVMFDLVESLGHVGIIGVLNTSISVGDACEVMGPMTKEVDVVAMSPDEVARYLDENRAEMTPQLITGLTTLGYIKWRGKFFE